MSMIPLISILGCLLFLVPGIRASGGGTTGVTMGLAVDARSGAMGEAQTAASEGAPTLYWNPAALTTVDGYSATLMRAVLPADGDAANRERRAGAFAR